MFHCINGTPAADFSRNCSCWENYQLRNGSFNECAPYCPRGCLGGNCIGPDLCECSPDRYLFGDNGRQSCELLTTTTEQFSTTGESLTTEKSPTTEKELPKTNQTVLTLPNASQHNSTVTKSKQPLEPVNDSSEASGEIPLETLNNASIETSETHHSMSLLTAAADHIYLFITLAIVVTCSIGGIILLKFVHKKIEYSVDKSGTIVLYIIYKKCIELIYI